MIWHLLIIFDTIMVLIFAFSEDAPKLRESIARLQSQIDSTSEKLKRLEYQAALNRGPFA